MQLRFVTEYISDSSSVKAAAIRAGYSIDTASQQGSRLLADPRVQSLINEANKKAAADLRITTERVLQELWKIAGANPGDTIMIEEDGEARIDPRAAGELVVTTVAGDSKKVKSVTAKTIKPSDKLNALEKIAKITNMFPKEDKEVKIELSLTELIERSMAPDAKEVAVEVKDTDASSSQ